MTFSSTTDPALDSWALMTLASLSKQLGQLDQYRSDPKLCLTLEGIEVRLELQLEAYHSSGVYPLALMELTKDISAFKGAVGK